MATKTAADLCRERGWQPGDILEGEQYGGRDRLKITAIGEVAILARRVETLPKHSAKWRPINEHETAWTLAYRDWHKVESLTP